MNVNSTDSKSLSLSGYLKQTVTTTTTQSSYPAKQLFNPNNPNKPIVISPKQQNVRAGYPPANIEPHHAKEHFPMNINNANAQQYSGAHYGSAPPTWYDPYTERYCCKNINIETLIYLEQNFKRVIESYEIFFLKLMLNF